MTTTRITYPASGRTQLVDVPPQASVHDLLQSLGLSTSSLVQQDATGTFLQPSDPLGDLLASITNPHDRRLTITPDMSAGDPSSEMLEAGVTFVVAVSFVMGIIRLMQVNHESQASRSAANEGQPPSIIGLTTLQVLQQPPQQSLDAWLQQRGWCRQGKHLFGTFHALGQSWPGKLVRKGTCFKVSVQHAPAWLTQHPAKRRCMSTRAGGWTFIHQDQEFQDPRAAITATEAFLAWCAQTAGRKVS